MRITTVRDSAQRTLGVAGRKRRPPITLAKAPAKSRARLYLMVLLRCLPGYPSPILTKTWEARLAADRGGYTPLTPLPAPQLAMVPVISLQKRSRMCTLVNTIS
jgi:hypothetical protein